MAALKVTFATKDEVNNHCLKGLTSQAALTPNFANAESLDANFYSFEKLIDPRRFVAHARWGFA